MSSRLSLITVIATAACFTLPSAHAADSTTTTSQTTSQSSPQAQTQQNTTQTTGQNNPDAASQKMMFKKTTTLNDIHHTHQMEMKLSTLAMKNSENAQVKAMAQDMLQDHQKADTDLKTLATNEKVELRDFSAGDNEQGVMDSLDKLHGRAFDMAFLDFQRFNHKALAGKLTLMSDETKDPQIKSMIDGIIPTVRHHQQMSANLEQTTRKAMAGQVQN